MELRRYLRLMGQLYFEGAKSDFHPDLLRRFGGSLAMAARDTQHIRIDPNSILGLERRMQDRWTAASMGWRRHSQQIQSRIRAGTPPSRTIFEYCRTFQTTPHRPSQLLEALQQVMMSNGQQVSKWQVSTIQMRQRINRANSVMVDTFGAIATMAAVVMTAEDWQHATPEEWDRAMNAGEVAMVVGQMAGAHTDARTQWHDTRQNARSAR